MKVINAEVTEILNHTSRTASFAQRPVRVLYLDDDEIDLALMRMHVKRHLRNAVELHCVDRPSRAQAALSSNEFDYLVTDNRIPPVSNYRETLDALDLSSFSGRIVVVSSETRFDCFDTRTDGRVHGVTDKSELSNAIKNGLFARYRE